MKIVSLKAENVKRLKAVAITPDGAVVRIQGQNGAGKTSVLDSIAYALGGEKLCPAEPIRRGAEKARAVVELDNGMIVERRWTAKGTYLEVRSKDGAVYKKPQALLDDLVGKLSFDPLAFLRLKPLEQAETLRKLAGIDFSALEAKRRAAYDARTNVNRQVAQMKARLATMPAVEAPDEPVSGADLLAEHQRRSDEKAQNEKKRGELVRARERIERAKKTVADSEARVRDLEEQLARERDVLQAAKQDVEDIRKMGTALKAEVEALVDPDLDEIPRQLREVESLNDRVRAKKQRAALVAELAQVEAEATKHDTEIASVDEQKAGALAGAKFPVAGLGFTDAGATFNGIPFEQSSAAEQLRVSVAMALAMNPKLKVMLIRDGSLLGAKSLQLVAEMAEQASAQVWIEQVAEKSDGVSVFIEDGEVEGAPAANTPAEARAS